MSLLGDAKNAPHWTENGIGSTLPICNGLEVVIILLMTVEDFAISNLIESEIGYVRQLDSCGTKKGESLDYEGNDIGTQPERVLDAGKLGVLIIAPLNFSKPVIATEEDPVTEGHGTTVD